MLNMEKLINEKKQNIKKIEALKAENEKLEERIRAKEKKLDEAIIKRNISQSGESQQKEDLERLHNPKKEKKEAIQTAVATTLTAGFVGTVAAGSINSKLVPPVLVASIAIGTGVGIGKLVVYKVFTAKNTEEDLNIAYMRCQSNSRKALNSIIEISDEIKLLLGTISDNTERIEALTARNNELSSEIGKAKREEKVSTKPIQKVKK